MSKKEGRAIMKVQFKGIKWINNTPLFLLYDIENKKNFYEKIKRNIYLTKYDKKYCVGYYDLLKHDYFGCDLIHDVEKSKSQCSLCKNVTGFNMCLGCTGHNCLSNNKNAKEFCNQEHIVYIAMFGNDRLKVGTAASYRKYERIQDQGAIASMFIAKTSNGKIARLIEHTISKMGYTLLVNSSYKIKNLLINKDTVEIKKIFLNEYKNISDNLSVELKKYLIKPEINYMKKINEINRVCLKDLNCQINLFGEETNDFNYEIISNPDKIEGEILNVIGQILIIRNKDNIFAIDTKKLVGYMIDIKIK